MRPATLGVFGAIAAFIFLGCYFLSPFAALRTLGQAARTADKDQLAISVDFPAVRSGFKDQFNAFIGRKALGHRNPIAGLAIILGPLIIDRAVDAFVTPDGVAAMLRHPAQNDSDAGTKPKSTYLWKGHLSVIDLDHLRMTYAIDNDPARRLALLLERRGLFGWKLTRIDLPLDDIAKAAGGIHHRVQARFLPNVADVVGDSLPKRAGQCGETRIKQVMTRLQEQDGTPVAGSGSAVTYTNGGYQVSYDQVPEVDASRAGDGVRVCLVSIPKDCPPGDDRGRFYHALNHRTGKKWELPDAEHMCGGA